MVSFILEDSASLVSAAGGAGVEHVGQLPVVCWGMDAGAEAVAALVAFSYY